jgi:lysophospholipase L1-like esterase
MRKRLLLSAVALALALAPAAAADVAHVGYPSSMASTGDSITRAFNTCSFPFVDCPQNSWSTGSSSTVNSHYRRILAANAAISGRNFNDAKTGARMNALNTQVTTVVSQGVEYVTVLMGANDVCTSSVSTMTPTATLEGQLQTALQTFSSGLPNARIYVVSIPNVYHLWEILHTNFGAVLTWSFGGICQSLLANPMSTAPADVARRQQVYNRTVDDNAALARVCAQLIHCRFDANAAFKLQFVASDVSTRDYFHPSVSGQAKAAAATWAATFDFGDQTAPASAAATAPDPNGGTDVTLSATDDVAVAGIEYSVDGGPYQRYVGTFVAAPGTVVTYRAVDVNGNIEATKVVNG